MRVAMLLFLMVVVTAPAWGQHAAPVAVRAGRTAHAVAVDGVDRSDDAKRFRGKRVLVGAAIGAVILGTLGGVATLSACDQADCGMQWIAGARIGAAVGGVIGGLFGLIVALPARD